MRNKKIFRRMIWILLSVIAIWLVGDFGYSAYVASRLNHWEQQVERDENGVMKDCAAYSVGSADTAVLLVHGINDTPYTWRKIAPVLADRFHVRAMRLPGFGERMDVCATKDAEDWVAAVKSETQLLRKNHQRVFVVAHSLGGAVTIQTILREGDSQQQLIDGAVLLAPAIEVSNRRSPVLPTRMWHRISGALLFTKMTYNPFGNDCKDPAERESANRVQFSPRQMINETFRLIDENRGREAEFKVPVLVVLSDEDQVNDHQASERWFKQVASDRKEIFWNNDSGHALQYDLGWELVADRMIEFFEHGSE